MNKDKTDMPRRLVRTLFVFIASVFALLQMSSSQAAITFVAGNPPTINSGSTVDSISFNVPAGVVAGDFLLAMVAVRATSLTITPPAGWTLHRRDVHPSGMIQAVYYRTATASEPASYAFTFNGYVRATGGIVAYRGVDVSNPFNAFGGQINGSSRLITAPLVTTTVANTRLVGFFGIANGGATISAPTGMSNRVATAPGAGPNGVAIAIADAAQAATGATGTKVATANVATINVGQLIALNPLVIIVIPGDFNVVDTGTPTTLEAVKDGKIKTKVAGSTFSLDIVALNTTKSAILTSFTGTMKVELLNSSLGGTRDANGCNSAWTPIQTVTASFTFQSADRGRKTLTGIIENNAWTNVSVRVTYPATGTPTAIGCSIDHFAIRPARLVNLSATDTNWMTAGTARTLNSTSASGGIVHKAGQPFTLRATAVNASSSPVVTGNYRGSPDVVITACLLPSGCAAGSVPAGEWTAAAGTVTNNAATYSEVGAFSMRLVDDSFADVDSIDGSTEAERHFSSDLINVGRFVPDHFELEPDPDASPPQFRTFNDSSCGSRSFTYIGQRFGYVIAPQAKVSAMNASGVATKNYDGNLWKIASSPTVSKDCTSNPDVCTAVSNNVTQRYSYALTPSSTPNWDGDQVAIGQPTVTSSGDGTGIITANLSDALAFRRSTSTPQSPFTANISLTVSVADSSESAGTGVSCSNPANCTIATATPAVFDGGGSGMAFDSGNEFRYGRLRIGNAHGSDVRNLPVPLEAQYWNGNSFVTNAADNCTSIAAADIAMAFQKNLNPPCKTAGVVSGAFVAGRGNLILRAPGAGNGGSADLSVNLGAAAIGATCAGPLPAAQVGATTANRPYLQGRWTGSSFNQNPTARATFGVLNKAGPVIYMREMY